MLRNCYNLSFHQEVLENDNFVNDRTVVQQTLIFIVQEFGLHTSHLLQVSM